MKQSDFLSAIEQMVTKVLQNNNALSPEWHIGVVDSTISSYALNVKVDGSSLAQRIPCNPNIKFVSGDEVFVQFVNGDSRNKYIPYKRATGTENTSGGTGSNSSSALANVTEVVLHTASSSVVNQTLTSGGNYIVYIYIRVVQASNISVTVQYSDTTGTQTQAAVNGNLAIGSYSITPVYFNATTSSPITINASSSTDAQAFLSASIVEV